jgi:elongator complex protein 1
VSSPCLSFRAILNLSTVLRSDEVDAAEPTFTEFCAEARVVSTSPSPVFVGLSRAARLHVSTPSKHRVLGTNVTSFASASGFIIYTTSAHEAHFVPLDDIAAEKEHDVVEKRRIERGARIVSAVPSALSLVLQMPRGNLETIAPRPMVMAVVHRDIAA